MKYMIFDHVLYIKVFEHNSLLGGFFNDAEEVKSCRKPGKFSILESMDQYKYGDKFQFMLYYPEKGTRNIWQQDNNPCTEGPGTPSGYNPILTQSEHPQWKGLCLSSASSNCFIDGTVTDDWWYAIGAYTQRGPGVKTFPGPNGVTVHLVQLWLACGEIHKDVRLNSNIYKRVLPGNTMDMEYINSIGEQTPRNIIIQSSHGFQPGQAIFKDDDGLYKLSCADNTDTAWVHGLVTEVIDDDTFVLQRSGKYPWYDMGWEETTVVYLSDKVPGELLHYSNITSMIYTPVAIFASNCLIICPQQPSQGIPIREYDNESWTFDNYTGEELLDTIKTVYDYYKGGS